MQKKFLIPALILLSFATVSVGQEPAPFKMPCPEVLKLGFDKFVDAYVEKTDDYSSYGQKQAFSYYVDCKRPANDQRAARLSATARKQVDEIRQHLKDIGDASWSNEYIVAGGGTMYSLASVGAYAVREDFISTLITAMQNSRAQPNARRRANAAVRRAKRLAPAASPLPQLEHWDESSRADQLKHYRENVENIRSAMRSIQRLVPSLPDGAAAIVAGRMADELDVGPEE